MMSFIICGSILASRRLPAKARRSACVGLTPIVAMRWTLGRLALHNGARPIERLGDADVDGFLTAVRRFGERPDLADYWARPNAIGVSPRAGSRCIGQLRLVLYHRGQAHEVPRKIMPSADDTRAATGDGALIAANGSNGVLLLLRPATVYHLALTRAPVSANILPPSRRRFRRLPT